MFDCTICNFHQSCDFSEILVQFGEFSVRHSEEEKNSKGIFI